MKAVLTGANTGIGSEILDVLLQKNYEVIVIDKYINELKAKRDVKIIECDLSNIECVQEVCKEIEKENIEVLINNAGVGKPTKFREIQVQQMQYETNVNLFAPILLIQAVYNNMERNKFGRIVNISSTAGKEGVPFLEIYSATKAALNSITQSLAKNLKETGITINAVCPGGVKTEMSRQGRETISELLKQKAEIYQNDMIKHVGLGRLIEPKEIANFILFLIDEKQSYISGQCFNICGVMELR